MTDPDTVHTAKAPLLVALTGSIPEHSLVSGLDEAPPGAEVVIPLPTGELRTQGLAILHSGNKTAIPLTRTVRAGDRDLDVDDLVTMLLEDRSGLSATLPPFAAAAVGTEGRVVAATDPIGARHIYFTKQMGWAGLSSATAPLAAVAKSGIDHQAVAVQSVLGWQVGTRTWFEGVEKLDAGCAVELADGSATVARYSDQRPTASITLDDAVRDAAAMLRAYVTALLDTHPDATLQLTGGQDSRLLLSAIPRERRKGVRALTLDVAGSADTQIASQLAERYGLRHEVISVIPPTEIDSTEAFERVSAAARRLDYMADPLALAALTRIESRLDPGIRISGLGGEVARGFYYVGAVPLPVRASPRVVAWLANWRMFANESASAEAVDPDLGAWARSFATAEIQRAFGHGGTLFAASDDFYLFERMQRWAGVTDTAVCFDRVVINPMLDSRFLEIARRLAVSDKIGSRFLSRLQIELDAELADVPLDGRPPPRAFASRSVQGASAQAVSFSRRAIRKVRQRAAGRRKVPAGGQALADLIVAYWRDNPGSLDEASRSGVLNAAYLDRVASGNVVPDTATVALIANATTACNDLNAL